jgi:hypothetical protein
MDREQYRTEEIWSANRRWSIDTSFVHAAFKQFQHPVIESLNLRVFGSVSTLGAFTLENFDQVAMIGQNFKMTDVRGDRVDCSMRGLRLVAQEEYGTRYRDNTDQAGTTTNTSFECQLPICFHPRRAERPNDYLMSLSDFLDSDVIWQAATASPITASTVINSLTLQLQANIRENWTTDAPVRQMIREISAEKSEETFTVEGAVRYAGIYAYASGSDLVSLSTYTEVDSRTLKLSDMPSSALKQAAQLNNPQLDDTDSEVTRNRFLPLVVPDFDQHFTQLVDRGGKMHLKLQAALPTGGKLLTVTCTPRDDAQVAKSLGYGAVSDLYKAMEAGHVQVVGSKGAMPIAKAGLELTKFAPLRRVA